MNLSKNSGNIVLIAIIVSAMIIGFGVSLTTVLTSSILSIKDISESTQAYYMAEAGAENGYYIFSGHVIGFEYNYDNDATCEIESGEDKWCLSSRLNSVPDGEDEFGLILENGVLSVGLYNDVSDNPFGAISTSNVELTNNEIEILLYPHEDQTDIFNNTVGVGDLRVSAVEATSTISYDENTQIEEGDADIGTSLVSNILETSMCLNYKYAISGGDRIWDSGEFVYRDIDLSASVSEGDIRMTSTGSYGAGTTVTPGDTDIGIPLTGGGIENIGCAADNVKELYSTDIAQVIISGQDTDGNKSISWVISKNQLSGTTSTSPLSYSKNTRGNVGVSSSCDIVNFLEANNVPCGNNGDIEFPQLEIYALSGDLQYRINSTFSDFYIDNSADDCALCGFIDMAGASGASTAYDSEHYSEDPVLSFPADTYTLKIKEFDSGAVVTISNIVISSGMGGVESALAIQTAMNDQVGLNNNYSVSYREGRFQIISTGITLTNPEITLSSKGVNGGLEQSIQTSITDSSLVPIFGWYSVF